MATDASDPGWRRHPQVVTALVIGAVITLVGVLGFVLVPVEGLLLGIFGVNTLHNGFHLVTGVIGLLAGYYAYGRFSDEYNKASGLGFLLLVVVWLVLPGVMSDLLNAGLADTLLHLGLGVVLAGVGFGLADRRD